MSYIRQPTVLDKDGNAVPWQPSEDTVPDCRPSAPCGTCELCTAGADDERDSWQPLDLGPYLRGEVERPQPSIGMVRSDGLRLLYPGKEHAVIGEMESGKSWVALASAVAEMDAGNHVVYIHFEETDPSDTIERMLDLGATSDQILKLFRFIGPERQGDPVSIARLLDPVPSLAIFDGVNEGMSLHRLAIREEDGAAQFRARVIKPFLRVGAATLACDHVVKDKETRGRYALGSIHKGNALNGVQIMLENAEPFGRNMRGRSHVFISKDRPGYLRRHGRATTTPGKTFMGELVVDDTRTWNPWLELKFWAPSDKDDETEAEQTSKPAASDADDARVLAAVSEIRAKGQEANLRMVRGAAGLGKDKVDSALARLTLAGSLQEVRGSRGARIFDLPESAE